MSEFIAPDGNPIVKVLPLDAGNRIGVRIYCNRAKKPWAACIDIANAEMLIEALRDGLKAAERDRAKWAAYKASLED